MLLLRPQGQMAEPSGDPGFKTLSRHPPPPRKGTSRICDHSFLRRPPDPPPPPRNAPTQSSPREELAGYPAWVLGPAVGLPTGHLPLPHPTRQRLLASGRGSLFPAHTGLPWERQPLWVPVQANSVKAQPISPPCSEGPCLPQRKGTLRPCRDPVGDLKTAGPGEL